MGLVEISKGCWVNEGRFILRGVREHGEGYEVELIRTTETGGRWVVKARNEGGNNCTMVDLWDLLGWLQSNPPIK